MKQKSIVQIEKEKRKLLRNEKQTFQAIQSEKYTKVLTALKNKFTINTNTFADNFMSLLENKYFL
jgi:hypothetical protein